MPVNYGHHRSDRIAEILSPKAGIRDEQVKKGIKPHDHARDNVMRIRAMQKLMAERKAAAAAEAAKPKVRKYEGIGSRVAAQLSRPATAEAPRPSTPRELPNFACPKPSGPAGRAFTAWAAPPLLYEGLDAELPRRQKRNPPVPRREPPPPAPPAVDFVKRNAELSSLTPRKHRAPTSPGSPPGTAEKSKYHGRVPPYLLDRKLELAQKAAAVEAAKAPRVCPEGTRILPESERVEVLAKVKAAQVKVHAELDKMPFVVDTFGLKQKHQVLTKQLAQLSAAEAAFTRSKVIVADEGPVTPTTSRVAAMPELHGAAEVLAVEGDEELLVEPLTEPLTEPAEPGAAAVVDVPDFTHEAIALAQEAAAMAEEVSFQHPEEQEAESIS